MLRQRIINEFDRLLQDIVKQAQDEVRAQGHVASGRGLKSIEGVVNELTTDRLEGVISAFDYMVGPIDKGVAASRVPYTPNSGKKTSKYIDALIDWIRKYIKPSYSEEEAKSFAFAIANTAIREGHPTRGAYSFSKNGRRTGWIESGVAANVPELEKRLRLFQILEEEFGESLIKAARG